MTFQFKLRVASLLILFTASQLCFTCFGFNETDNDNDNDNHNHNDNPDLTLLLLKASSPTPPTPTPPFPSAFDYYNNVCKSSCGEAQGQDTAGSLSFPGININPCPKCKEKYSHEHCNHCCQGGASSLKLRWIGCAGILELDEGPHAASCGLNMKAKAKTVDDIHILKNDKESERDDAPAAGFVRCDCYESYIRTGYVNEGCEIMKQMEVRDGDEICIVATTNGFESHSHSQSHPSLIDLTQSLPDPLVLKHKKRELNSNSNSNSTLLDDEPRPDVNEILLTMIETSCDGANPLPIYPPYGKFAGSCPKDGFIDLRAQAVLGKVEHTHSVTKPFEHFSGVPQVEFFYEFMDGTSVSFWPTESESSGRFVGIDKESFFDPTFASCSCIECPSAPPSEAPTSIPSLTLSSSPTSIPSGISTGRNTIGEQDCSIASYANCYEFSTQLCLSKEGGECSFNFDSQRKRKLQSIVETVERQRHDTSTDMDSDLHRKDALKDLVWIFEDIDYHSDVVEQTMEHAEIMQKQQLDKAWAMETLRKLREKDTV